MGAAERAWGSRGANGCERDENERWWPKSTTVEGAKCRNSQRSEVVLEVLAAKIYPLRC